MVTAILNAQPNVSGVHNLCNTKSLDEGIENTQLVRYKSYQIINHGRSYIYTPPHGLSYGCYPTGIEIEFA
jgi:hypothetical protein